MCARGFIYKIVSVDIRSSRLMLSIALMTSSMERWNSSKQSLSTYATSESIASDSRSISMFETLMATISLCFSQYSDRAMHPDGFSQPAFQTAPDFHRNH